MTRLPISGDAKAVTILPGRVAATDHAGELRGYESKYRREGNLRDCDERRQSSRYRE
ncbi:hypothetical protein BN2475_170028 [Paraburkholderia ribeironis]|uniref:Uncharacterized protein n=1 Tax=Paraburkholderia ribeironis TaxID=1247936 RepID=A0A1N7RVH6_9BURK|nr:hypothetical protein BN2475_170028 [Paraburkholderia ribeironis]